MINKLSKETCLEFYGRMKTIRDFEEKVFEIGNLDEIRGPTHLYIGEEAVGVGVCSALKDNDIVSSTHRGMDI